MIVNIRGTSGSGKTTVVRGLSAKAILTTPLEGTSKKPHAYLLEIPHIGPVYIIGSYQQVCGGCDAIPTQDEICRRIRQYAPLGHVIAEGLLMSHLFSRYAMLDREMHAQGIPFIWGFLDTPLDVCLDRVRARREERRLAKKNPPEAKPLDVKNTTDKWHDMRRVYQKCVKPEEKDWSKVVGYQRTPLDARWIDHTNAVETVYSWLR